VTGARVAIPNLVDPKTYAEHDMDAIWRQLRTDEPVYWHPATAGTAGFWVITRHDDIVRLLRDDRRLTSESGNVLDTLLRGGDTGAGRMLAVTDGSRHADLRKLLLQPFAPRALETVTRRVRAVIRDLMREAVERGRCDFARDVASVIPLETICDLLDLPARDRPAILRLTKSALASDYAHPDAGADQAARNEILIYFSDLVRERRQSPGSDPISLLAAAGLDDEDIILNCYSLIMGGDETSRLAMIGAVHALIQNPDQWRALKQGTVSLESAVEEVLRWATPTMHFGRAAVADIELRDRAIAPGDVITLWFASANRDERAFEEPGRFSLARSPNRHLSLGYGRHFCLGAYLGRIEINAMLDGLRSFVSRIGQAGDERRIFSNFLSGMSSLPVTMEGEPNALARWNE
jgi:cytochrome P450